MSIIRTEVSGYHHIGFYDTEFIIKGTLYIDTRKYSFLHYDGAFGFSRLEIKAGKVKASYDEAEGFQMQQGKEAPEGGLLNANRKDAIKQIQEAAISYLTTDLNAWAEYFNLATRSAGPFAYTLTQCITITIWKEMKEMQPKLYSKWHWTMCKALMLSTMMSLSNNSRESLESTFEK